MSRRSILLINQDPDTVRICTDLFSGCGFEVLAVEGTEEGLRLARAESPAVIVAELRVPTATEWQVIETLKDDPGTAHIPLIALTAHALAADSRRAGRADLFLVKPADFQHLLDAVERLAAGAAGPPTGPPDGAGE